MNNPLILFVGQSGSGKTTIANELELAKEYKQVQSYTTRVPRYDGEVGHTFVSEEEFDKLGELVAYTEYNGSKYGVTADMLNECQLYVIDVPGVQTLLNKYQNKTRQIYIFYLKSTVTTRIDRMLERGDHDTAVLSRLHNDEQYDWFDKLYSIVCEANQQADTNVLLYIIDANKPQKDVVEDVLWYLD